MYNNNNNNVPDGGTCLKQTEHETVEVSHQFPTERKMMNQQ